MPRSAEYTLSWSETQHLYELSRSSTRELLSIITDSPQWFAWLSIVSSFAFHGKKYSFTARRESTQRGETYWYGYLRIRKKVRKKYLGRTADLCSERLEQVAALLHSAHPSEAVSDGPCTTSDQLKENAIVGHHHKSLPEKEKPVFLDPLLATKLCIPCPPMHLILRVPLFEQLQSVLHYPLTLITASAGFGKTTLLSSWLHSSSLHASWISLDSEDNDPPRFWSYFFTALNMLVSGVADTALSMLRLQQPPVLETLLTSVINNLAKCSTETILVLDDYHVITSQAIHQGLTFLLDHQPPTLHLIFATRVDPPLPLARFRMRAQLLELRSNALCFNRDEISNFLAFTTKLTFSDEELTSLHMRTEGWIAGLQLFALSLQGKTEHAHLIQGFTGGHRYIFDYLVQEILARQSAQAESFLLQTSILEHLHGSLCEAVTGQTGGQAMLEALEQCNLFLQPLDDERQWYRYHQLFADVLRLRLRQKQPSLLPVLYQRAIDWCEKEERYHEAVTYALAIKDFERVAHIIDRVGVQMVEHGEVTTIQRWLSALPGELIRSRLRLCLFEGWRLALNNQYADAERLLQEYVQRQQIAHMPEEQRELLGEQLALRSTLALRGQRNLPLAIDFARQALTYYPPESMGRALLLFNLGTISWMMGDQQTAIASFSESISISQRAGITYSATLSAQMLCTVLLRKGQLRSVERLLRQFIPAKQEKQLPTNGPLYICLGMLLREWNRLDEAVSSLRQGIACCQQLAEFTNLISGYVTLARVYLGQADGVSAREVLREGEDFLYIHRISERQTRQIQALQVWCAYVEGDETEITSWLQSCTLSIQGTSDPQSELEYLLLARLLRFCSRLDEAQTFLCRLLCNAEEKEHTGSIIEILVQLALVNQAQSNAIEARKLLMRALALAEPEGYLRVFFDEAPIITPLLTKMREEYMKGQFSATRSCSLHYLDTLLAFLDTGKQDVRSEQIITDLLSERELEVLGLLVSGCSNRAIANRLVIALSTVKSHVNTIYNKLDVGSRTQAIARAHELHLILPMMNVPSSSRM